MYFSTFISSLNLFSVSLILISHTIYFLFVSLPYFFPSYISFFFSFSHVSSSMYLFTISFLLMSLPLLTSISFYRFFPPLLLLTNFESYSTYRLFLSSPLVISLIFQSHFLLYLSRIFTFELLSLRIEYFASRRRGLLKIVSRENSRSGTSVSS